MTLENYLFSGLACITLAVTFFRFGWNSFVGFGILGAFIYSTPAMIGIYSPIHATYGLRGVFYKPSLDSVMVLAIAWLVFLFVVSVLPVPKATMPKEKFESSSYLRAACIMTLIGYLLISFRLGPLYFLNDRADTDLGIITTLWRWCFVFGLVISFLERRLWCGLFFGVFLVFHTVAGDRTIPAITFTAILLSAFLGQDSRQRFPPFRYIVVGGVVFLLLLVTKPIYLFIKNPSADAAASLLTYDQFYLSAMGFEPFGTYSLLEFTVTENLQMPFADSLISIFGNFLVMPSAFGIDTNLFNTLITENMSNMISFGVAGNYFAHAFASAGVLGVFAFSIFFILSTYWLEKEALRRSSFLRVVLVVAAATITIYAHRNGLDNVLSFLRQIIIVSVVIGLISAFDRAALPRKSQRAY